jgi:hypothetical protein
MVPLDSESLDSNKDKDLNNTNFPKSSPLSSYNLYSPYNLYSSYNTRSTININKRLPI